MAGNIVRGVFVWLLLVGVVGLPYWIVLIPLHDLLLGNELRRQLAHSPALWFTFGSLAASHFWKAFRMGYDTMPDKELKQRARWDLYLLILRAIAMFFMAAHGLYFILVPLMALLLSYLEIWPDVRSVRFSAIRRGFGNTILAIRHRTGAYPDVHLRGTSFHWWFIPIGRRRSECFLETSDRHKPSKLIKNQNASTINADKLNLKIKETIISSAPPRSEVNISATSSGVYPVAEVNTQLRSAEHQ